MNKHCASERGNVVNPLPPPRPHTQKKKYRIQQNFCWRRRRDRYLDVERPNKGRGGSRDSAADERERERDLDRDEQKPSSIKKKETVW